MRGHRTTYRWAKPHATSQQQGCAAKWAYRDYQEALAALQLYQQQGYGRTMRPAMFAGIGSHRPGSTDGSENHE
jgi:hypothetical protein